MIPIHILGGLKSIPFPAAHLYSKYLYNGSYPPPPPPRILPSSIQHYLYLADGHDFTM